MTYLTYEDYKDMGGTVNEATFNYLLVKATARINYVTANRINEDNIPDTIGALTKNLIDIYSTGAGDRDASLTSYSNGIESFSYAADKSVDLMDRKVNKLVVEYLSAYPELVYRGVVL